MLAEIDRLGSREDGDSPLIEWTLNSEGIARLQLSSSPSMLLTTIAAVNDSARALTGILIDATDTSLKSTNVKDIFVGKVKFSCLWCGFKALLLSCKGRYLSYLGVKKYLPSLRSLQL